MIIKAKIGIFHSKNVRSPVIYKDIASREKRDFRSSGRQVYKVYVSAGRWVGGSTGLQICKFAGGVPLTAGRHSIAPGKEDINFESCKDGIDDRHKRIARSE